MTFGVHACMCVCVCFTRKQIINADCLRFVFFNAVQILAISRRSSCLSVKPYCCCLNTIKESEKESKIANK